MTLLFGDIRFAQSARMVDAKEGGGPPSAKLMTSGRYNEIFPDISMDSRVNGRVEIYSIFGVLRNTDLTMLGGANVILSSPPNDPRVGVTILSLGDSFATRADIAARIERMRAAGPEFGGYLLQDHYATMGSISILQRPEMVPPGIGLTFLLIFDEGKPSECRQRITIKSVKTEIRKYTVIVNGQASTFDAQLSACEMLNPLLYDFPGSPPDITFARQANKTLVRETTFVDAGVFYSAARLEQPCAVNDTFVKLPTIYTQVVPNSRTESNLVDQRPSSRYTIVLAESPRRVEVGITPHSKQIVIGENNAGKNFVERLFPLPEPGLTFIDFFALGQRYNMRDDGTGRITGSGGGAVSSLTGDLSITTNAIPDINSSVAITWGTREAYTDRSNQGVQVRAPEFVITLDADAESDQARPGSITGRYTSANVEYTFTDDSNGGLSGDATGVVDYAGRILLVRPKHMPDAGAQIALDYQMDNTVTEYFPGLSHDAGGFIQMTLAQQPAAKSVRVQWATARAVSNTSGGNLTTTTANKDTDVS
ncbi:MAG: hypothetical protein RSF42_16525, partial [Comamonas sp.]